MHVKFSNGCLYHSEYCRSSNRPYLPLLIQNLSVTLTKCYVASMQRYTKGRKKLKFHGSRVSATTRDTVVRARRYSACRSRHENWQKRGIPGTLFFFGLLVFTPGWGWSLMSYYVTALCRQVSAWQSATLLPISCNWLQPVPARVEEPVSPVRQSFSGGATNNPPFPKMS